MDALFNLLQCALFYVLGITIIVRAARGKFLAKFRYFYSYLIFSLLSGIALIVTLLWRPNAFAEVFWLQFLSTVLMEFAILVEVSDNVFNPYPLSRRLGRLLIASISLVFASVYLVPAFRGQGPSSTMILDILKRASLVKGLIIVALLFAIRLYGLSLSRNTSGIMLGLTLYLAVNTVNFGLAEIFGQQVYGRVFAVVGPLSRILCLLVWVISLWDYQPVLVLEAARRAERGVAPVPVGSQLKKLNTALVRLLRK